MNIGILGAQGFSTLAGIADKVSAYHITFNEADEIVSFIEETLAIAT